jgi:hypothetical protein
MLILFLNWKSPFPQILLQSFEVLGRNGSGRSFAFVFAPSPKKGRSFKSIDSYFLRRLSMAGQRNTGRDEAFHHEVIVWHLTHLGNILILGFRVIQHYHHFANLQRSSFLVSSWC